MPNISNPSPRPRPDLGLLPVLGPTRLQLRTFTHTFTHTFAHTSHPPPPPPQHPHHSSHPHHTPTPHTHTHSTHPQHPPTPHHPHHTSRTTPRHATPRHATPRHATPRHATPRHATPRHATPRHATPRQVDDLLEVAWTCRRWRAAVQDDCLWACTRFSACDGRAPPELEPCGVRGGMWGGGEGGGCNPG